MRELILLAVFVLAQTAIVSLALAEKRVALVIGNAAYQNQPKLRTPLNDVDEVVRVLKKSGFLVIEGRDLTKNKMDEIFYRQFLPLLAQADVSLFYYSGHALQVNDINHLIPIDAKLRAAYDLEIETINFNHMMKLIKLKSGTRLFFLDACRDNPFTGKQFSSGSLSRSLATRGMAPVRATVGTLVTYSTAPGEVAYDGEGRFSPFTSAFTRHALTPKLELRQMMTRVRRNVMDETENAQVPWERSALIKDFHFIEPRPAPTVKAVHQVHFNPASLAARLGVPAPYQKAGGDLRISFSQLPQSGALLVGTKNVTANMSLTSAQFEQLSFKAQSLPEGSAQIAGYTVEDDWGNQKTGLIVINKARQGSAQIPAARNIDKSASRLQTLVAGLRESVSSPLETIIGVGPVSLGLKSTASDESRADLTRMIVIEPPASGQLQLAGRALRPNSSLDLKQITDLQYIPAIGDEGRIVKTRWKLAQGGSHSEPIEVRIRPVLHACDKYAAQPFDLQSISQGVYSHHIVGKKAEPACIEAMGVYPHIPRFVFQLGRAELALGQPKKARQLYRLASGKGHIRAFHGLGILQTFGGGGKVDHKKANKYFAIAAAKGDAYSLHSLGKRIFRGLGGAADQKRGLTLLLQAANMGHVFAMNELTRIFRKGDGVTKNTARSLRYAIESSRRKDTYGYHNLGFHYLDGDGVPTDYAKALEWFVKAHKGQHPEAGNSIGRMYANGWGVSKNIDIAAGWYELSARRGSAWAANNRARLALDGPERLQNPVLATRYYALSAAHKRGKPSQVATRILHKIPDRFKVGAIRELLTGLGYQTGNSKDRLSLKTRKSIKRFVSHHKITQANDLNALLTELALKKWIKDNPRIDLF